MIDGAGPHLPEVRVVLGVSARCFLRSAPQALPSADAAGGGAWQGLRPRREGSVSLAWRTGEG